MEGREGEVQKAPFILRLVIRHPPPKSPRRTDGPAAGGAAMLIGLLRRIARSSPRVKRSLWRTWYQYLAAKHDEADWTFMNYGFVDLNPHAPRLALQGSDEGDRLSIQLYHHVAASVDLRGWDVLEVGCGRGGGCSYIMRYLQPRTMVGVDVSRKAIDLCNRHYAVEGLSFSQGDAESLPFSDGAFNAVINVESSHCYGSMERFLVEVCRVLRPRGYFLFGDLRSKDDIGGLREQLRASGLKVLKEDVITLNVLGALERDSERKQALIRRRIPRWLRGGFRQFAGLAGTLVYEALRTGRAEYLSCVLQKTVG